MRRATSRQAVCFWARNKSVRSSNTITYPIRWPWPALEGDRGDGHRHVQADARSDDLHLAGGGSHAVGFAQQVLEIGNGVCGKQVVQGLPGIRRVLVEPE